MCRTDFLHFLTRLSLSLQFFRIFTRVWRLDINDKRLWCLSKLEKGPEKTYFRIWMYTPLSVFVMIFFLCVNCFSFDETYTLENLSLFTLGSDRLLVVTPFVSLCHCDYLVLVFRHSIQKWCVCCSGCFCWFHYSYTITFEQFSSSLPSWPSDQNSSNIIL